ncbi:MAG: flagellin [Proteobacteria bacterium]|nr:flagellin [Pseudomonadota bacterium]
MSVAAVNTNGNSNWARYGVAAVERDLDKAMIQLSTGKRTTSAVIDAAGIGKASILESETRAYKQAARQAFDGASAMLAADAMIEEVMDIAQRQRELAVQYEGDAQLTTAQKAIISTEIANLATAATQILAAAKYNNTALNGLSLAIKFGSASGGTITATAGTVTGASGNVVSAIDTSIANMAEARGKAGAFANALTAVGENQLALAAATSESLSRVQDTDYAQATAELARASIVQQAAMAMVAQANQQPSTVLTLLR